MSVSPLPSLPSISSRSSIFENADCTDPTTLRRSTQFEEIVDPWNNNLRHDTFRSSSSISSLREVYTDRRTVLGLRLLVFWILVSLITIMLVGALSIGLALGLPAASKHHYQTVVASTALSTKPTSESTSSLYNPTTSKDATSNSTSTTTCTTSLQALSPSNTLSTPSSGTSSCTFITSTDNPCHSKGQRCYSCTIDGMEPQNYQVYYDKTFPLSDHDRSNIKILNQIFVSSLVQCMKSCSSYNKNNRVEDEKCTNVAKHQFSDSCWLKTGNTSNIKPRPKANGIGVDSAKLMLGD